MKFSVSFLLVVLLVLIGSAAVIVNAFVPKLSAPAPALQSQSQSQSQLSNPHCWKSTRLCYDIQRDHQPNDNVWSILANTEKWISDTLAEAQTDTHTNPLRRKEVSYVCEPSVDAVLILANIFRRVKEARQLGESHAQDQEALIDETGEDKYDRVTMRQTQVLVLPACEELSQNFLVFDAIIGAINQARKVARDLVTDHSLEKLDEQLDGDGEDRDWVVSVNCAHLHPKYGEKTPEQELQELQEEELRGEVVDLNLEMYKKQRLLARRSPYPSVVIEVRSMAPPKFTPPQPTGRTVSSKSLDSDKIDIDEGETDDSSGGAETPKIDTDYVNQLEALFSKSSLDNESSSSTSTTNKEGDFYESIGSHIETVSSVTPLILAQNWIHQNDPLFDVTRCSFTVSDAANHVDEAYEFLFTNLGMQTSQFLANGGNSDHSGEATKHHPAAKDAQKRQYMVVPHFLSSSATSLEKFTIQAERIIRTIPSIGTKVNLASFHPEHVREHKRCPVPVIVLQWE